MCEAPADLLARHFSEANLKRVFEQRVQFQSARGTDGLSPRRFADAADSEISIIRRKVFARTYEFSRYREKLILKGRDRPPRVIAIPTVRDKLVMRVLNECLEEVFDGCHPPPINQTIARIKHGMRDGSFTGYLRLDIKDYYPTIQHEPLLNALRSLPLPEELILLAERGIKQRTFKVDPSKTTEDIPQGLPISNALANLYLDSFDRHWRAREPSIQYSRFVDDILILGQMSALSGIHQEIIVMMEKLGLEAHDIGSGKSQLNGLAAPVNYLGYSLSPTRVSVREGSVRKLKESLIGIVVSHTKRKAKGYTKKLLWRLNLRITGCIVNGQRFGWLCFFSEINDVPLLKSLDVFVDRLLMRWKLKRLRPRKFVRGFFEIHFRSRTTRYVPSFDDYTVAEKVSLLKSIFGVKISSDLSETEINSEFRQMIRKETMSLEEDLVRLS